MCTPCVIRQNVLSTAGPAQIPEKPAWSVTGVLRIQRQASPSQSHLGVLLPVPRLPGIASPEPKAFPFTKETQIQKASLLKKGTHWLLVTLGSKWLTADCKCQ